MANKNLDPITVEVIGNALVSIADEMVITLERTAYSTVVREAADCSTALYDNKGQLIAQAAAIPAHLGSLGASLKNTILKEEFPLDKLNEGDSIIMNHPYRWGMHLPDISIFTPIFVNGEVIAIAGSVAHHLDVGGRSPGSIGNDVTDIYQEGLIIPPLKLYNQGTLNQTFIDLMRSNIRDPETTLGDLRAQIAANQTAVKRFKELAQKYTPELILSCARARIDNTEERMRARIAEIPDGIYEAEGYLDDDGINRDQAVTLKVTLKIEGSNIYYDFTGTDKQTRGPVNCAPAAVWSACYYATRCVLNIDVPQNEGAFRPIDIFLPQGSVLNPIHPAPCGARHQTLMRVCDILINVYNSVLPKGLIACSNAHTTAISLGGFNPRRGKYSVYFDLLGGGMGARRNKDGIDGTDVHIANCKNVPIEAAELEHPILFKNYALIADSGGPGLFRGGLGIRRDIEITSPQMHLTLRSDGEATKPCGIFGGKQGLAGSKYLNYGTEKQERVYRKVTDMILTKGDVLAVFTPGSGGFGSPLERDLQSLQDDVWDGKVSLESAVRDYGVRVIDNNKKIIARG